MYTLTLLVCVGVVTVNSLQLTRYSDCGSKKGKVNSVSVDGCPSEPCHVHKGTTYHVTVNFTATARSTEAHNALGGIIAGFELPFPVTPSDECADGMKCPIEEGATRVYSVSLNCPFFAPTIKLASKWHLKDENRKDILCFVVPLEIVG